MLALPLFLDVKTTEERTAVIEGIDRALAPYEKSPAPFTAIRKVGQPYVNTYLDNDTRTSGYKYFPLFMLFVIVLNWILYRSFRALCAFVLTLGVCAAMTVAFVGVTGGTFTIVSALVPMTILITCTATLVYLHSRFVEVPDEGVSVDEHQTIALANKFVAATASIFATAVGFAALAVSEIRPIRELGLWVAAGLVITWITVFTLFPALQKALNTPTELERKTAGQWFVAFTRWLPGWSYRWRWLLVPSALVLCAVGAIALFGIPGLIKPMELQTNAIEYIPHDSPLYKDTKKLEEEYRRPVDHRGVAAGQAGHGVGRAGAARPARLLGRARIGSADRHRHRPDGDAALAAIRQRQGRQAAHDRRGARRARRHAGDAVTERADAAELRRQEARPDASVGDHEDGRLQGLRSARQDDPSEVEGSGRQNPELGQFKMEIVGLAPLQAKISQLLVPTLTHSFALTVVIIFAAFLLVFRSGPARLMAMIPSLFAILVMFLIMRLLHMNLNVATILIASTVLGTSENDQIHFFYHFQEARNAGCTTEEALRHTLGIAGRAIFFATIINAGGFLAFAFSTLPPVRQFGVLSAIAFLLSMIADFTALPAALWMVFRECPDEFKEAVKAGRPKPR